MAKVSKNQSVYPILMGENRLNFPISIVKGISPNIENKTTLGDLLAKIQTNDPLSIETAQQLKTTYESGNKKSYDQLKQNLHGFVIGDFQTRKDADCLTYVPMLVLDIDGYPDSLEMSFDFEHLKKNPFVFAAFPSPSSHGLRILVWSDSTFETHKAIYTALLTYFADWLNMTTDKNHLPHLDTSTSNPSRLWFYTATKDVYLNLDSQVFTPSVSQPETEKAKTPPSVKTAQNGSISAQNTDILTDSDKIQACEIIAANRNITRTQHGRNEFLYRLACICFEHGISNNAVLSDFNRFIETDFTASEIKKTVDSASKRVVFGKFSEAQLNRYVKNGEGVNGKATTQKLTQTPPSVKPPIDIEIQDSQPVDNSKEVEEITGIDDEADAADVSRYAKIESYLQKRYDIRFNTVARELEIRPKNKGNFEHLDDFKFNDLLRRISKAGHKVSDKTLAVSLYSSFTPFYNPFKEYFENLPKWAESDKDHIAHLASFVNAKDPYWFKIQFKKALVRAVACGIGVLSFNKHCLTFQGKQNDGKTSFIRFLCPPQLEAYLKENFKVDKDGLISLCQNLIVNLDELDTLSKSDTDQIKSVFTTSDVKKRLPYARTPMKARRTASFFGSTNRSDFLTDETGNVRWLVIESKG